MRTSMFYPPPAAVRNSHVAFDAGASNKKIQVAQPSYGNGT